MIDVEIFERPLVPEDKPLYKAGNYRKREDIEDQEYGKEEFSTDQEGYPQFGGTYPQKKSLAREASRARLFWSTDSRGKGPRCSPGLPEGVSLLGHDRIGVKVLPDSQNLAPNLIVSLDQIANLLATIHDSRMIAPSQSSADLG